MKSERKLGWSQESLPIYSIFIFIGEKSWKKILLAEALKKCQLKRVMSTRYKVAQKDPINSKLTIDGQAHGVSERMKMITSENLILR